MTDIMKHQGYISNEDRNKNIKKLDKGNGWRKFVIATALIAAVVLGIIFLLGLLGEMGVSGATSALDKLPSFTSPNSNLAGHLTWYGIVAIVILGIVLIFGCIGFWFAVTMISAKDASHRAIKLSKIALPGKKNSKSVAKDVKNRVTQK